MSNSYTKTYLDGSSLTEAELDTALQSLQLDVANTNLMTSGSTSGQVLTSNGNALAASFQSVSDPLGPFALRNYGLKATAAAGVLTVNLKTKALGTPSTSDIVDFTYSTNGSTSASYSQVQVTAAVSLSINASATLGFSATSTARIFVYGYYNSSATAVRLAVSARSDFDGIGQVSTTAMAASSDSKNLLYASAALTVIPRLLGLIDVAHNSGGSWQTPSKVNLGNTVYGQRNVIQVAAPTATFSTTSGSFTDVTGLTGAITTSGRPVTISFVADSNTAHGDSSIQIAHTTGSAIGRFQVLRGTVSLGVQLIGMTGAAASPFTHYASPSALRFRDYPVAGTYTYKLQVASNSGDTIVVAHVGMELEER